MKSLDVIAIGSCYVDINVSDYPFGQSGIANETELIGGQYETVPGGSAVNFCRLLGALGMRPAFIGVAGADSMGDLLETLLKSDGVEPKLVRKHGVQTNIGFNMTSPIGGHIMCVAGSANATLSPDDALPVLRDTAKDAGAIYLGGCFKLKSFSNAFRTVAEIAAESGAVLYVDHGRVPADAEPQMLSHVQELILKADYYLASRDEFTQLWNVGGIEEGMMLLHDRSPQLVVVIKDGANGAYYAQNGETQHIQARKVNNISNLTGAGDSFNAGFMAAISVDKALAEAVSYGCAVAAAKISGNAVPQL